MNNESRDMARTSLSVIGKSLKGMGESLLDGLAALARYFQTP
jgi:hypothetical protein